jgi:putative ABC transport system permease protein
MKYWTIVYAGLTRKKWRTVLTISSIAIAFLLFGLLRSVAVAFTEEVDLAGDDRLVVMSKLSFIEPLPFSYWQRLKSIEGVKQVAHREWFGGTYQDRSNFFPKWPVPPKEYFEVYSDLIISEKEKNDFINTRTGMVVGQRLAERFNWKIGDKIPIMGDIYPKKDGEMLWTFDLVGIFSNPDNLNDEDQAFLNYYYFDEARSFGEGTIGNFVVQVDDKSDNERIAKQIDTMFANSSDETKTGTEASFSKMFASQIGDVGFIMNSILSAVFFTILLVTGNTMSQAIRERTSELAVFKTIGYLDSTILLLVLAESAILCLLGAIIGIGLALFLFFGGGLQDSLYGFFGDIAFKPAIIGSAMLLAILTAIVSGLPPAIFAMRLKVVDALRRN